jgi:hypothetical protein
LIAVFGTTTAAQIGRRWLELEGLAEKVAANMGIDNGLRNALIGQIEYEKDTLLLDVMSRLSLAGTGVAAAGLGGLAIGLGATGGGLPVAIPLGLASASMGVATGVAFRPVKSRHRGLAAIGAVDRTTGLPTTFLNDPSQLNHLMIKLNTQTGYLGDLRSNLVQNKLGDEGKQGLNQFKYGMRAWEALAKAVPDADRRALIQKMVDNPQAAAPDSMQIVARHTQVERDYLAEHKLPLLRKEVELLLQEYKTAQQEATESSHTDGVSKADEKARLLATALHAKSQSCFVEEARLSKLQDLDQRMKRFMKNLNKDFLVDPKEEAEWKELQIDFIVAHDMAGEALGASGLAKVIKAQEEAQIAEADLPDEAIATLNAQIKEAYAHNEIHLAAVQSATTDEALTQAQADARRATLELNSLIEQQEAALQAKSTANQAKAQAEATPQSDLAAIEAMAFSGSATATDPLRRALYKNIDLRFAKAMVQSVPDKLAYERRGAIEVARMMFMEKDEVVSAPKATLSDGARPGRFSGDRHDGATTRMPLGYGDYSSTTPDDSSDNTSSTTLGSSN